MAMPYKYITAYESLTTLFEHHKERLIRLSFLFHKGEIDSLEYHGIKLTEQEILIYSIKNVIEGLNES